ncbi:MAG: type III pantothenate kinase [Muribaculaceae bacterium]|nr:type III pantothenate kinase [Muribaculaceae bacterium]
MESGFLAIDCGNTRLKTTLFTGGSPAEVCAFGSADVEGLLTYMELNGVEGAAMVSVGRTDVRLVETVRQGVADNFLLLTHNTPLPISIGYETPDTLGLDRVAAAAGARCVCRQCDCVIADAGTALTVDYLTAGGVYRGGTISPGVRMQLSALHEGTHLLPHITVAECGEYYREMGYDLRRNRCARNTRSAIIEGVVGGVIDRLRCSVSAGEKLLVTGGDGELLCKLLNGCDGLSSGAVISAPHLIAVGLKYIFDEYEKVI